MFSSSLSGARHKAGTGSSTGFREGGKRKEVVERALQGYGCGGKRSLDEENIFIRDGELFG
jgi:hypothetical protein